LAAFTLWVRLDLLATLGGDSEAAGLRRAGAGVGNSTVLTSIRKAYYDDAIDDSEAIHVRGHGFTEIPGGHSTGGARDHGAGARHQVAGDSL
jgi:hypothetical protein